MSEKELSQKVLEIQKDVRSFLGTDKRNPGGRVRTAVTSGEALTGEARGRLLTCWERSSSSSA